MDSKKYWIGTEKSVNNSANSAGAARPTNKGNGALAPGHPWAFKLGNNPLKNPSISAVTAEQSRPRMAVRLADEMASHLMPSGCGPIEKSGKISTNSTNSMISMLTHVEIGVVAPGRPLQFERGHSTDPNAMRPQFSTEKSVKTSANGARPAKPTNKGNGSSAPAHPWAFKPDNTPLKTPPKTVVTVADARTGVRSLVGGRATAGSPATAPSASFKASNIGRGLRLNARRLGD